MQGYRWCISQWRLLQWSSAVCNKDDANRPVLHSLILFHTELAPGFPCNDQFPPCPPIAWLSVVHSLGRHDRAAIACDTGKEGVFQSILLLAWCGSVIRRRESINAINLDWLPTIVTSADVCWLRYRAPTAATAFRVHPLPPPSFQLWPSSSPSDTDGQIVLRLARFY